MSESPPTMTEERYLAAQEAGELPKAVTYQCWLGAQRAPRRLRRPTPYEDRKF